MENIGIPGEPRLPEGTVTDLRGVSRRSHRQQTSVGERKARYPGVKTVDVSYLTPDHVEYGYADGKRHCSTVFTESGKVANLVPIRI